MSVWEAADLAASFVQGIIKPQRRFLKANIYQAGQRP